MPVKEIPVPTGQELQEPSEEQVEQEPEQVEQVLEEVSEVESKPVKIEESWTKVTPKRKAKAKKEEEKIDLKQRMPCPICKRICTLHALLYTHQCTKDAREARLKKPEKIETPAPELEEIKPEEIIKEPMHPRQSLMNRRYEESKSHMDAREALMERRYAFELRQREIHTTPIRNYFGRL